jgi:hypothetical protein
MPRMRKENAKPVAVCSADWHADVHCPPCRNKDDWWDIMREAYRFQTKLAEDLNVPLVIAGDIFNRWNAPASLINFLIPILRIAPQCYAVPGNHDLPYHNRDLMGDSAYGTLVHSGAIVDLKPGVFVHYSRGEVPLALMGYPVGEDLASPEGICVASNYKRVYLAVVHHYCWDGNHTHPGAKPDDHVRELVKRLPGFDAILFGDNHHGFTFEESVCNNGTVIIRRSDEANYLPSCSVLYSNGFFDQLSIPDKHAINLSAPNPPDDPDETQLREFMEALGDLGEKALNFEKVMRAVAKENSSKWVRETLLRILEQAKEKSE